MPIIPGSMKPRVAVVLVKAGETEQQAWRRHLNEHPEDDRADIRIFHFPRDAENASKRSGELAFRYISSR
jgi:hypothetical protein